MSTWQPVELALKPDTAAAMAGLSDFSMMDSFPLKTLFTVTAPSIMARTMVPSSAESACLTSR